MDKKALLIIDVQVGMFSDENPVYHGEKLLKNLKQLLFKARATNTPIFYIQHNSPVGKPLEHGTNGWKIHPDLSPTEIDILIQKTTPDSFFNTNLDKELKKQEIKHLIITGIQSEVCVDTTTRRAFSMKYEVTLVTDSHSTWGSEELTAQQIINHHNQVLSWFANTNETSEVEF
ncbi:cysteine hydrolase family protein [Sporosarcina sp. FSL K6-1540]|uniref:cysteine hydrolase family protein n=1 Tax=Sporosarcina sp. FSL K6-1540 TaxID=2921555 RepID=UPI003159B078